MSGSRQGAGPDTLARVDAYDGASVAQARSRLRLALERAGCVEPAEDARRLVAHALRIAPSRLGVEAERMMTGEEAKRLRRYEADRLAGRTVGRIVGTRAFHDIALAVSDDLLEPRDDTAAVVELALPKLRSLCDERSTATVWDVGTGVGTIVMALLAAEPRATGLATDVSDRMGAWHRNAERLGLGPERLRFARADVLEGMDRGRFDLIVSNPPYIPTGETAALIAGGLTDPALALDGGADGLRFYRRFAETLGSRLNAGGWLVVEIGAGQGADLRALFTRHGWRERGAMTDLGGHERALAFAPGTDGARGGG